MPKPYVLYTDSTACLSIASNALRLGNVRHLAMRYNLVRCYVTLGEITMCYCITEEMVADLLTKIVAGEQDTRLAVRFTASARMDITLSSTMYEPRRFSNP